MHDEITQAARLLCQMNPSVSEAYAGYALGRWLQGDSLTLVDTFSLPRSIVRPMAEADYPFAELIAFLGTIGIVLAAWSE